MIRSIIILALGASPSLWPPIKTIKSLARAVSSALSYVCLNVVFKSPTHPSNLEGVGKDIVLS